MLDGSLDHRLLHCDERNSELRKGWAVNSANCQLLSHDLFPSSGCVLHIALPILRVDNIFHQRHHARRRICWSQAHVYAEGGDAAKADGLARRSHSGLLLVRPGLRLADSLRKLQHAEEQLRSRCVAGVGLQCLHRNLRIGGHLRYSRL